MKLIKTILLGVFWSVTCIALVAIAAQKETVEDRIKPVGELCMAGDDCASDGMQLADSGAPRSGEDVYKTKCFTCHATGAAGAPKYDAPEDWKDRMPKGMDVLYTNAIKGYKGMPAMGLCMDCSEAEIKASVDYLVGK